MHLSIYLPLLFSALFGLSPPDSPGDCRRKWGRGCSALAGYWRRPVPPHP